LKAQISFLYADWGPQTLTKALHPLRPVLMWYYNRVLRQELLPLIKAQMKEEDDASEGFKTISRLALRAFKKEYGKATEDERRRLEAEFLDVTVEQMKIFFFAGHDTTSSTLCFAYAELCNHPEALRKVREEHDSVFGTDASKATQLLTEDPVLLNKLPYTAAIMKEVLRMYPPIGSVRAGSPTLHLADPKVPGRRLPTDGFMLHDCTLAIHRHPDLWFKPDEFIPERWLESEGGKIEKNTFRAFSLGPRNCIGQELAMTELKMLLVMTIRELDFELAYTKDDPRILGSQTFQAQMPGELVAHPSKGLPVRISLRQQATT
jgi:cytochrome P450